MRFHIHIIFTIFTIIKLTNGQQDQKYQTLQFRQQQPQQFASRERDLSAEAAAIGYRQFQPQQQQFEYDDDIENESGPTTTQSNRRPQPYRKGGGGGGQANPKEIEEDLIEEEEPDRLALLLEKSTFQCDGKTSGYYADEGLGCEVFHYCQENQKHSWICPEGFSFHQVYLICMPPSGDNICEQSSKYHIVNEYLYKPINIEEHEAKPNISLRYSERYYPEDFYHDERHDNHEYTNERQRQPIQVGIRKSQPASATPIPYRQQQLTTIHPQHQQNVYRSPDEINISLQQRRPQIVFSPTTQRYDDDDYNNYDK